MRKLLPLLCLVAGLAGGTAAGYALWAEDPPPRQSEAPAIPEASPQQPAPKVVPKPPAPEVDAARLMAGLDLPQGDGQGALDGLVRYEDGRPVAGVQVRATPFIEADDASATPQARLEAFARRRAAEHTLQRAAHTDAEGRYRVSGLDRARRYALTPTLAGHEFRPERRTAVKYHGAGGQVDFIATTGGRVKLLLTLPGGRAPDAAFIEVVSGKDDSGRRYWNWTVDEPTIPARVGAWRITAQAGENREYAGEALCEIADGEPVPDVPIALKLRSGVIGAVVPQPGMEEGMSVQLLMERDGKFPQPLAGDGAGTRLSPNGGWTFSFLDLAPGKYRLCVVFGARAVLTHDLAIDGDLARANLAVPEPVAADFIIVRVTGPEGPAVKGVNVYLSYAYGNGHEGGGTPVMNRRNGEYWVPRNDSRLRHPDGFYQLEVRTPFGNRTLRYEKTDTRVLEAVFAAPAAVIVDIAGFEACAKKESLRVSCTPLDRKANPGQPDSRDDGRGGSTRRFSALVPGRYEVVLFLELRRTSSPMVVERKTVDAIMGDNHVQFTAPILYSITVIVPEEFQKQQLNLQHTAEAEFRVTAFNSDPQRPNRAEQVFEDLIAGEYRLQANPAGVMKISLPAMNGQRVTFAPQPFNAYRLVAVAGSKAADVGLRDGDMVIEIDGTALADNFERRHDLIGAAAKKEATTWVVMRAGARVSVTFDGRKWGNNGLRGEPARLD